MVRVSDSGVTPTLVFCSITLGLVVNLLMMANHHTSALEEIKKDIKEITTVCSYGEVKDD